MYMRMSLIITMAVWWSVQAVFTNSRKLPCSEASTSSRTWGRKGEEGGGVFQHVTKATRSTCSSLVIEDKQNSYKAVPT